MKKNNKTLPKWLYVSLTGCMLTLPLSVWSQGKTITGSVVDADDGSPLMGATIMVEGSKDGTVTDMDGNFKMNVNGPSRKLSVSYLGYDTQEVSITNGTLVIKLHSTQRNLNEVVVVGYGTTRRSDLTGSVSTVQSKDFNKGLVSSPEQLINGKVAGVQIMSNSGSATAGSTIRIRGGASLNASNDPLIVLDGIPLEQGGISGNGSNFLSLINPNDIESMTVLKDASSTAIYGSRASNGVIIITTKKGAKGKLRVNFSTTNSLQTRTRMIDMMSRDEFVNTINTQGTAAQRALLGNDNTDWNNQVYRTAFGTDNNLSLSGTAGFLPFRVSTGFYNQDGLVRKDNAKRWTGNVVLNPSFFQDHLKLTLNVKGTYNKNSFYNGSAIWAAATFNPTLPVYADNTTYGGYNEALDASGVPVNGGVCNPRGLVDQYDSRSTVKRLIGSFDMDYKLHFFPDVKLHATVGTDIARGEGTVYVPTTAASNFSTLGLDYSYGPQKNTNQLMTLYANYSHYFEPARSNVEVTAGYDYQYWKSTTPMYVTRNANGDDLSTVKASDYRHVLKSYYGRLNYSFDSRYLLTATLRRDGTSRFSGDNRWGTFPSVALGWTMTQEKWLKDSKVLSNLKLQLSAGLHTKRRRCRGNDERRVYPHLSSRGLRLQSEMGDNKVMGLRSGLRIPWQPHHRQPGLLYTQDRRLARHCALCRRYQLRQEHSDQCGQRGLPRTGSFAQRHTHTDQGLAMEPELQHHMGTDEGQEPFARQGLADYQRARRTEHRLLSVPSALRGLRALYVLSLSSALRPCHGQTGRRCVC
jgi:iron complex outermembrane receptor protein